MAEETKDRRLSAILSADVVGYSRLMADDEERTIESLARLRSLVDEIVAKHQGRVVDFVGDNFLAELPSAVNATLCALEIQEAVAKQETDAPEERRMRLRIGAHVGDVRVESERIFGNGVNVAARLEGLAEPGGLCVSASLLDLIEGRVDVAVEDLGPQTVKNIPRPVHAYRLKTERNDQPSPGAAATPAPESGGRPVIAVLPFENLSADPDQAYLADGMTADVIAGLSCHKRIQVIARNSMMQFKGKSVDVREVGASLGARYVVEGSIRGIGKRVRVTTELVDAETGAELWSGRSERPVDEIFDLQDEVTEGILTTLVSQLRVAEEERVRRKPPEELEAWALCTRAEATYFEAPGVMNVDEPVRWLRRAVEIDPQFAHAWALLGFMIALRFPLGLSRNREADIRESIEITRRAMSLDPNEPSALTYHAVALQYAGKPDESLRYLERSLRLNPSDAITHLYYGRGLMFTGRPDDAIAHFERFQRLNPSDPGAHMAAMYHSLGLMFAERWEDAERVARDGIAAAGGQNGWTWVALITALGAQGRIEEAHGAVERLHGVMPDWTLEFVSQFFRDTQKDDSIAEATVRTLRSAWPTG